MKKLFFLSIIFLSFSFVSPASAQSEYVLPYPSAMPGSVWYNFQILQELVKRYWYFGNLSQFSYNLKKSDKYLIEAKTLFEYKQYLLASKALKRSDEYYSSSQDYLKKAAEEGKDISEKFYTLKMASLKHKEILSEISTETPTSYIWTPEKEESIELPIYRNIKKSIKIREDL